MKIHQIILVCLSLISVACDSDSSSAPSDTSSPTSTSESEYSDAVLVGHLNLFLDEAANRDIQIDAETLSKLDLSFSDLPPNTLGACWTSEEGRLKVLISDTLTDGNSKWVTLHELGHCLLNIEHRDEVLSIMNTVNVDTLLEQQDEIEIFDEFFQEQYFNTL